MAISIYWQMWWVAISEVRVDEKEWDLMITMNLKSAFLISKHVIPQMILSKYGRAVHVSSRTGLRSTGYDSAYAASKSGLIRLVESLAEETKESNINVNYIMPSILKQTEKQCQLQILVNG